MTPKFEFISLFFAGLVSLFSTSNVAKAYLIYMEPVLEFTATRYGLSLWAVCSILVSVLPPRCDKFLYPLEFMMTNIYIVGGIILWERIHWFWMVLYVLRVFISITYFNLKYDLPTLKTISTLDKLLKESEEQLHQNQQLALNLGRLLQQREAN